MPEFHTLTIAAKTQETPDAVRLRLAVPPELRDAYRFLPGQHVAVRATIGDRKIRRTYSLCSSPDDDGLEIGVRLQPEGTFSGFVQSELEAGGTLDVMTPSGGFHLPDDGGEPRSVALFAAGSGITPILSIARAVLAGHAKSRVVLFFGNRGQQSTMFIEDLYALKNTYTDRLQLVFLFSREEQEFDINSGRLDAGKTRQLWSSFCSERQPDDVYICGPDTMIQDVSTALTDLGVPPERIHAERFGVPRQSQPKAPAATVTGDVQVTVIMDGHRRRFDMRDDGRSLVDAAAAAGIELPYSCKGGVCATCRTHLKKGQVRMDVNYGLEPWEVESGFVLACQSHPESAEIELDYDRT